MSFYTDVIQRDPRFTSAAPCRDTALLEPGFRAALAALIADAAALSGIRLIVTETFRSQALQEHDFQIGASQLRTVGVHHYGLAADVARIEGGKADWTAKDYWFLGPLCAKHGLVWGGDWGNPADRDADIFHDWDHIQAVTVEQQDGLFSGAWYPAPGTIGNATEPAS